MKFTETQLAFLMTKITVDESFISEASVFKVKRKPRTVKVQENVVKCSKVKKNGECCVYNAKVDGLCGKHSPKTSSEVVVPVVPVECIGCGNCDSVFRVKMEDGSYSFACEHCVDAGAIEGLDYDDL